MSLVGDVATGGVRGATSILYAALGETIAERAGVDLRLVALRYSGDNAAMIAHAALLAHRRGEADDPRRVDASSRIALETPRHPNAHGPT